jgi:hypothetical protein
MYRPKNPYDPNTVAVMPLFECRPPGPARLSNGTAYREFFMWEAFLIPKSAAFFIAGDTK